MDTNLPFWIYGDRKSFVSRCTLIEPPPTFNTCVVFGDIIFRAACRIQNWCWMRESDRTIKTYEEFVTWKLGMKVFLWNFNFFYSEYFYDRSERYDRTFFFFFFLTFSYVPAICSGGSSSACEQRKMKFDISLISGKKRKKILIVNRS